jgi:hypothetical protein
MRNVVMPARYPTAPRTRGESPLTDEPLEVSRSAPYELGRTASTGPMVGLGAALGESVVAAVKPSGSSGS